MGSTQASSWFRPLGQLCHSLLLACQLCGHIRFGFPAVVLLVHCLELVQSQSGDLRPQPVFGQAESVSSEEGACSGLLGPVRAL